MGRYGMIILIIILATPLSKIFMMPALRFAFVFVIITNNDPKLKDQLK